MSSSPSTDTTIAATEVGVALRLTCEALERAGVWYCLVYGTLLGAIRGNAVIEWDTDFDLLIRPSDLPTVLALDHPELRFDTVLKAGAELAIGSARTPWFDPGRLAVFHHGRKIGDLFAPVLFDDGVLRCYDLEREVYWTPHSSVPHYFFQGTIPVSLAGRQYPGPLEAAVFLEGTYGPDWRVPYRAVQHGGEPRPGFTTHGDTYHPHLADQVRYCLGRGWDTSIYRNQPKWPRFIQGAGPRGATARTRATSRSLWWHDLEEVAAHF